MLDPPSQKSSILSLIPSKKLDNCLKIRFIERACLVLGQPLR